MKANFNILTIGKKPMFDSKIFENSFGKLLSTPKKQVSVNNKQKSGKFGEGSNFSPDILRFRRKKNERLSHARRRRRQCLINA